MKLFLQKKKKKEKPKLYMMEKRFVMSKTTKRYIREIERKNQKNKPYGLFIFYYCL
jgi:hypothetical protein